MSQSASPALPRHPEDAPLLGFTAWVDLRGPSASDVLAYRRTLDRHLDSRGLVRSMNPLQMLLWSPQRSLTVDDQLDLLGWMVDGGLVARVALGSLHPQVGIPFERDRVKLLTVNAREPFVMSAMALYRAGGIDAVQCLEIVRAAAQAAA